MYMGKGFCHPDKKFPTFAALLLAVGVLWLLSELKVITIDIPWWPVVLIIFALGMVMNHCYCKPSKKKK